MANTTFSGPVRSENGFEVIDKSTVTGAVTPTIQRKRVHCNYYAIANGATSWS